MVIDVSILWTDSELTTLREMFDAGFPDDEIAKVIGRSHVAIKVKRAKSGITGDRNARRISNDNRAKMAVKPCGANSWSWKGGRRISSAGYAEIFLPNHHRARGNGYVFEHILVAEKLLGRKLVKGEDVHHKDENKENNSPDNLQILSKSKHSSLHGKNKIRHGKYIACPVCGEDFYAKASHVQKRTTCSIGCASELFRRYYTGKPRDQHISDIEKLKVLKEVSKL